MSKEWRKARRVDAHGMLQQIGVGTEQVSGRPEHGWQGALRHPPGHEAGATEAVDPLAGVKLNLGRRAW
jgi:hypothetical protein